jgi:hypothetical protein
MDIDKELESIFEGTNVPTRAGIADGEIDALMAAIADVLKEYVPAQLAPVLARLDALDKTIAKLSGGTK